MFAAFVIADIILSLVSVILYGRARMQEKASKEQLYLRIHSISLLILLLAGIAYMFFMVETAD
jgi:hypothetical protein